MNFRTLLGAASLALALTGTTACVEGPTNGSEIIFHSSEALKAADMPFSMAVESDGWIFLSGVLGTDPEKGGLAEGGIEGQSHAIMQRIKTNLESLDLTMDHIVKCTVMIGDMADWPAFNVVYKSYFDGDYPARSAFGANGLALGAAVEVECIAKR